MPPKRKTITCQMQWFRLLRPVGYWLGEKHHGKGYMKELAPVALAAAFKLLDVEVIEAGAQPENTASLAVMRGCGREFTGERMVYAPARKREEL
jgi:ribosomal-protein-alanine N-acetyltransferase